MKYSVTKRQSVGGTHGGGELATGTPAWRPPLSGTLVFVLFRVCGVSSIFVLAHGDLCIINTLPAGLL